MISKAPDQWWAIFFPIWPDLVASTQRVEQGTRNGRRVTGAGGSGRADLHVHSLASDGTAGIDEILLAAVAAGP